MRKPIRAALYARVSTRNGQQDPEVQLQALREVAERAGWQIVGTYVDHGISGAKGREKRPEFDRLLNDATRRKMDLVAAWSVDRLGRSLQDLVGFLSDLKAAGCDLYLHVQALDTTTPAGKALFQMLGVFAEFERAIIQERVRAGLDKARANGKRLGRPTLNRRTADAIRARAAKGEGKRAIGRSLGVPESTVRKVIAASEPKDRN
jgi:DNA invertase Pin-like site-specific DNA recombinase